jgi:hypothetical protein
MSPALKWTTIVWLGVLAGCAACYLMFIHAMLLPVAWVLGSLLLPIVLPPLFVVIVLTPGTAPDWQFALAGALALYVWLFGLFAFGLVVKALNQQRVRPVASL